jgi:hypothetical protein
MRAILFVPLATLTGCSLLRRSPDPEPTVAPASQPSIERGGFVATLGTDTVHIERFERAPGMLHGTIVTRIPTTRVTRWTLSLDAAGAPVHYTMETRAVDGTLLTHNWASGTFAWSGDTIVRRTIRNREPVEDRIAAPRHTLPGPGIPYVGVTYLTYELAFADARRRAATAADTALYSLPMLGAVTRPAKTRAWLVGADSAELSYFGVARSGYRFDESGRLMNADWTGTTYRYRVRRIADVDVEAVAQRWGDADRLGRTFGALSPRDTVRAVVGTASVMIDYSRPARRGRVIWGDVVPWEQVWRLGADMATHFTTGADLVIGETTVPAGRYTLWMIPSMETSYLVVSSAVNVFGTAYNPARDFARIPLRRMRVVPETDRLTLSIADGALVVRWEETAFTVPVRLK